MNPQSTRKSENINLKPSSPIFELSNTTKTVADYYKHLKDCLDAYDKNTEKILSANEIKYLKELVESAYKSAELITGRIENVKSNFKLDDDFRKKVATQFSELVGPLYAICLLKKTAINEQMPKNINKLKIKIPSDSVPLYDYAIILENNKVLKVSVKGGAIPINASLDKLFGNVNTVKFNTIFKGEKIDEDIYGKFEAIVANNVKTKAGRVSALTAVTEIYNTTGDSNFGDKKNELGKQLFDFYNFKDMKQKKIIISWLKSLKYSYKPEQKIFSTITTKAKKDIEKLQVLEEWLKKILNKTKANIAPNDCTMWYASFICEQALQRHSGMNRLPMAARNSNYKNFIVKKFIEKYKIFLQSFAVKPNGTIETKISIEKEDLKEWFSVRSKNSFNNYQDKLGIDPVGRKKS